MATSMPDAVCLGEALVDFVPAPGQPTWTFVARPGGAPANVAVGLARLGVPVAFVGRVGLDPMGVLVADALRVAGVDIGALQEDAMRPTPVAIVLPASSDLHRFLILRSNASDGALALDARALELLAATRLLHVGTLSLSETTSRSATLEAVAAARSHGAIVSVDVNLRPPAWADHDTMRNEARALLVTSTVAKLTEEELALLGVEPDQLIAAGVRVVLVTAGARGATAMTPVGSVSAASPVVGVVEATGAGDAFVAAFLAEILVSGFNPASLVELPVVGRALNVAAVAGSLAVQRSGAMESLPTAAELQAAAQLHAARD